MTFTCTINTASFIRPAHIVHVSVESSAYIGWLLGGILPYTGESTSFKVTGSFLLVPFSYMLLIILKYQIKPQPFWVKSLWFRPEVRVSVQQDDGNVHNCVYWDGDITNVCLLHTET